jgi:dynein heavy chain
LFSLLFQLETTWATLELTVAPHGKDTAKEGTYILGGVEDIFTQLEDSQVVVGTIKGSRYIGPVKSVCIPSLLSSTFVYLGLPQKKQEAEHWDQQLSLCSETLEEWINCQRDWMYLESIFSASDIQRQLPSEYKLFLGVDKSWKGLLLLFLIFV